VDSRTLASRLAGATERLLTQYVRDPTGLRVTLRGDALPRGEVDRLVVEAEQALVGELARRDRAPLRVRGVRIEVEGLLFNPARLWETGALEILDARALRIRRLTVTEADLAEFLRGQRRGSGITVRLEEGAADVLITRLRPAIHGRARLLPGDGAAPFRLGVADVSVGAVRVPGPLVGWVARHFDPSLPLQRLPVPVALDPVRIAPGRIEVGG
jgi:hypothetical protein